MKGVIEWFAKNHVAANFLMLLVLVLGVKAWLGLRKEIFPETAVDMVTVTVRYPAAAPEEVESGVVMPIEEEIQNLNGIKKITSNAGEGVGVVVIEVKTGFDVRDLMSDVKTRVDAIENFPEEAEEPLIQEIIIKNQTLSIGVSAETDEKTLRELAESVKQDLLMRPEISQVEVVGARDYEISIEVSERALREFGLTFEMVADAVRRSSLDLPGGSVKTEGGEVLVRTNAKRYTAGGFESLTLVTRGDGTVVTLGDVAEVVDGFEDTDRSLLFDGKPALLVKVFRTGDEDTLEVAAAAKQYIEESRARLPDGVTLEVWIDDSSFLSGRMKLLAKNGAFGLALVFLVLALFLRPSLAALVALGIPVSFAGAVWLMPYFGLSVNMISLFAFILVLGIVVDDAIVVGENVFRRMRLGEEPHVAAIRGTHEVGVVVVFGVVTTMVAFTPMMGIGGVSGKIWVNIPYVVIPTLLFSLLQSKLVLPSHLAALRRLDPDRNVGAITRFRRRFSDGLEVFVEKVYQPFLDRCLRWRYVVLTSFVAAFVIAVTAVVTGWIRFEFFPQVEAEIVAVKLKLPNGVPFEQTEEAIGLIASAAERMKREYEAVEDEPVVKHILASSGSFAFSPDPFAVDAGATGVNIGDVTVELSAASGRSIRSEAITARWREIVEEMGGIPGAVELSFQSIAAGAGNAIDLQISGDDLDKLEAAVGEVKAVLEGYSGVRDVADNNLEGKREMKLKIRPEAEALGLRLGDLARQVRQGFYGEEAQRLQRGDDEVKVMVRYPREQRTSIGDIEEMRVRLPDGSEVPFTAVAEVEYGRGYASISRANLRRAITITADIDKTVPGVSANQVVAALESGVLREVAAKYGVAYSFQGQQQDQRESVSDMMMGFGIALLGMYLLMAVPLRSYVQPAIIMSVIPFGIVGAVVGHVLMRTELSIMSLCGIVALAGVVVNDSLVLVNYVNRERELGHPVLRAAWEAGGKRFRPILLTSLTTFAGLSPMLLETDLQAKFLIPMAISLAFGILFATVITLLLVPCLYLILDDLKRLFLVYPERETQNVPS